MDSALPMRDTMDEEMGSGQSSSPSGRSTPATSISEGSIESMPELEGYQQDTAEAQAEDESATVDFEIRGSITGVHPNPHQQALEQWLQNFAKFQASLLLQVELGMCFTLPFYLRYLRLETGTHSPEGHGSPDLVVATVQEVEEGSDAPASSSSRGVMDCQV